MPKTLDGGTTGMAALQIERCSVFAVTDGAKLNGSWCQQSKSTAYDLGVFKSRIIKLVGLHTDYD